MLTENAKSLLKGRYIQEDEENWDDVTKRVAKNIAKQEKDASKHWGKFRKMMYNLDFLPNSPTLMNAGTDLQYLSACLVLPVEDSMEGIYDALKNQALVTKAGAGTGFAFSRLRPKGDIVHSTGKESTGPLSFMHVFAKSTEAVKQGGRRRGANMGVLNVHHPDILDFINAKTEEGELKNFNLSVGVTDEFMQALNKKEKYKLYNPRNNEVWDEISAKKVWNEIIENAHQNGEPGVIFLDTINKNHPVNEKIEGVNVCGEQALLPYESCNLGAINLSNFVDGDKIEWDRLQKIVRLAVRFLDDVIDANNYPIPEIEKKTKRYRKIGAGVMGWHEMLIKLNIRYDSKAAIVLAKKMGRFIRKIAIDESERLGQEKGVFPGFDNTDIEIPRRNAVLTTVAPTGSRSIIANTSGGIEPFFSFKYKHEDKDGNERWFEYDFTDYADDDVLVTAQDISPEWHVKMQAAWQKNIGAAVSKTINMPNSATIEDVENAYKQAYKTGCKGITIYRDGSRSEQVLSTDNDDKKQNEKLKRGEVVQAQDKAEGIRYKLATGCGTLYLTIVLDDEGNIIETFSNSSNGGCTIFTQATSRLISLSLRGGIDVDDVIDQLMSAGSCPSYQAARANGKDVSPGASCAGVIGLKLKEIKNDIKQQDDVVFKVSKEDLKEARKRRKKKDYNCPECGAELEQSSGCVVCRNCGWSKCD